MHSCRNWQPSQCVESTSYLCSSITTVHTHLATLLLMHMVHNDTHTCRALIISPPFPKQEKNNNTSHYHKFLKIRPLQANALTPFNPQVHIYTFLPWVNAQYGLSSRHGLVSFWFSYVADCIHTHTPKTILALFAGRHSHWESKLMQGCPRQPLTMQVALMPFGLVSTPAPLISFSTHSAKLLLFQKAEKVVMIINHIRDCEEQRKEAYPWEELNILAKKQVMKSWAVEVQEWHHYNLWEYIWCSSTSNVMLKSDYVMKSWAVGVQEWG